MRRWWWSKRYIRWSRNGNHIIFTDADGGGAYWNRSFESRWTIGEFLSSLLWHNGLSAWVESWCFIAGERACMYGRWRRVKEFVKMLFWEFELCNGLKFWALDVVKSFRALPSFIAPYISDKRLVTASDECSCNFDSCGKMNWTGFSVWADFPRSLELKQIKRLSLLSEKLRNSTLSFL